MAQERAWRPTDYWPQAVYVPPRTQELWEFEASQNRGSAERARVRRAQAHGEQSTSRQHANMLGRELAIEGSGAAARIRSGRGEQQQNHQRSRKALTVTVWKIVAWALAYGLAAGIVVALVVAVVVLHLA